MNLESLIPSLKIKERYMIPKYIQLADGLHNLIKSGVIKEHEMMPSLHELSTKLEISKKSVEKAYDFLKDKGIVISVRGLGHFATGKVV